MLGNHISLPTFNLSTTSLRHISKWYERLQDISDGVRRQHPNYLSDPESLGLVSRRGADVVLTPVGRQFLQTGAVVGDNPARAEYELIDLLYFAGNAHSASTREFLARKRQNLFQFLSLCHPSPTAALLLYNPKLLTIAEALVPFPGAVSRFLDLDRADLMRFERLGERGFTELWGENQPPAGLGRLARKIGADYTRAADRRLHFLMSMLLHVMRDSFMAAGASMAETTIPEPFSRLVTDADLIELSPAYAPDLGFASENGRLVAIAGSLRSRGRAPGIIEIGVRTPAARARRGAGGGRPPVVREPSRRIILLDLVLAKNAEDYVERSILRPRYGNDLIRVGHTNLESIPLADGLLPGADFYVPGVGFFEVKSSVGQRPPTFSITRTEYQRARKCHEERIPYELFVVGLVPGELTPHVYHIPRFAVKASELSINDLVAFDLATDYN